MKIIDLGICIDNIDPKGLGRIRVVNYDDYVAGKEKYKEYTSYDENDPFVALPFLPISINFIPEVGQAVKIIRYDTEKTTVNQEYIAGPFSTSYDFTSQTFAQQISSTTYGVSTKGKKNIFDKNGKLPPNSENSLSKPDDFSIDGKYGSDAIFTNCGIVLRGGKLLSKDSATIRERKDLKDYPLSAKKVAKLQLKKFPEKRYVVYEKNSKTTYDNTDLKYVIEYSVDDLANPTMINFYIYKIISSYGNTFKTNSFLPGTILPIGAITLLNEEKNTTSPTFKIDLTALSGYNGMSINNKIKNICSAIRLKILDVQKLGLENIVGDVVKADFASQNNGISNVYPFYFRPTFAFKNMVTSDAENQIKISILDGVKLTSRGPQEYGLVWSSNEFSPPGKTTEEETATLKKDTSTREQTFASIVSDKLYLLSQDTNFTNLPIDFSQLNSYEYTQDDYLDKIDPNTYAVVRGEVLIQFLTSMYNVLISHVHNINKPYARTSYDSHTIMENLFNKLQNDLLNNSIRIN